MSESKIVLTDVDYVRLREMINSLRGVGNPFRPHLRELAEELARATVLPSRQVPRDVVTMNSDAQVLNVETGRRQLVTLAYHGDCDMFGNRLSVLTPFGVRLIGQRVGDVVRWDTRRGGRQFSIESIPYQPEAAGHFYL